MRISCDFSVRYSGSIEINNKSYQLYNLIRKYSLEWLSKYSEIYDALAEYLYIDGVNYAYLINYFIDYSSYYFSSPGLDIILPYIIILDEFVDEGVELEIVDTFPHTFKECARMVCNRKGVKLRVIKESYIKRRFNPLYNNHKMIRTELVVRLFLRYLIGLLRKMTGKDNRVAGDVLLLSNTRFSAHNERENLIFGPLINGFDNRKLSWKVLRYEKLTQTTNLQRFVKEFMLENVAYIGDYYTLRHFIECERVFKQLRKRWNRIKYKEEIKQLFVFRGYNFYELILPRLELVFNALSYIAADTAKITKKIIEKEGYKVLVLDHEENMYGKGFMLNTRTAQARKTLALSHELIYPGCIHTHIKNPKVLDKSSKIWRPLPDIKCVWGDYAKKILVDYCNYPEEIIKTTGNPKFDILFKKRFDRNEIIKKYGLSAKVPKVLYASPGNNIHTHKCVFEIARQNPDLEILIKPHPNENLAPIIKLLSLKETNNLILLPKHANIYELISVSEYVITLGSTVGFEAMLMNKLVFILNPEGSFLGGLPYVKSGAAIEIRDSSELMDALKKLSKPFYRKKVESRMNRFVNFIHSINDGKASQRVADLLEELLA